MNNKNYGWEIGLHGENDARILRAYVHPLVSNVWNHGRVLDQTKEEPINDHSNSWIKADKDQKSGPISFQMICSIN